LRNSLRVLIFVVLLTGLPGLAGAQALWDSDRVVEIDSSFQSVLLDSKLDYLEDSGAMLSIKEVLAEQQQVRFVPNRQGIFSAGYTDSSYWFRFRLLNREERVQRLILLRERDSIEIKAWKVKGSVAPELIWDKGPLPAQQGLSRQQRLGTEVELAPLETVEVYLKLRVLADLKAVLTLWSPAAYAQHELSQTQFFSATWGAVLLFSLLALLVFVAVGDWVYLYYSLFLFFFLWLRIQRIDMGGGLTEWLGPWGYWMASFSIWGTSLFAILFSLKLFNLSTGKGSLGRSLIIGLCGVLLVALLTGSANIALLLTTLVSASLLPLPWYWGIRAWRKGNAGAKYYLMGLGMLALPAGMVALMALGIITYNLWVNEVLEISALLDCVAFTVALAVRFQQLQYKVLQDQQQALQKMEESDLLKEQFLASTTHELKTPLQGIIGLSLEVLEQFKGVGESRAVQSMEVVLRSAKQLNFMINNLLDSSSLQLSGLTIQRERTDPKLLIQTTTTLMQPRFALQNTPLQVEAPSLPTIYADGPRIEQVLLNLLSNALKYAPGKPVHLSAREDSGFVRFELADSGKGVEIEFREKIFQRFERGKVQNTEGLGLGLALCKEIVEKHEGQTGVENSPFGGAKFWFTIPVHQAATRSVVLDFQPAGPIAPTLAPVVSTFSQIPATSPILVAEAAILVVDDEPDVMEVLVEMFRKTPWQITYCSSGREALEYLSQDPVVDLVLLDVMMPEMDGFEVCEVLRQNHPPEKLPVLFLTALMGAEYLTQAFQAGASDYLTKPVIKPELINRISSHLELKALRQTGDASKDPAAAVLSERELLAATMQECLQCWKYCHGKDVVALAQESSLWGFFLDKSTSSWKAPGISQYLSSTKIPQRPRWRKVTQTVEFLLHLSTENDPHRKKLTEQLHAIYEKFSSK